MGFLWNAGFLLFSLASPGLRTVLDILYTLGRYFRQYIIENSCISGPPAADLELKQFPVSCWGDQSGEQVNKGGSIFLLIPFPRSEREESVYTLRSILHAVVADPVGLNSLLNELHTCVSGWLPSAQWEQAKEGEFLLHPGSWDSELCLSVFC